MVQLLPVMQAKVVSHSSQEVLAVLDMLVEVTVALVEAEAQDMSPLGLEALAEAEADTQEVEGAAEALTGDQGGAVAPTTQVQAKSMWQVLEQVKVR